MSATAERDGMELIAVVMKAPSTAQRFEDAKTLLDYGFANYALINSGAEKSQIPVKLGVGDFVTAVPAGEDAVLVDTGALDLEQSFQTLLELVQTKVNG